MSRIAKGDIAELESKIGPRGSAAINSGNRALVQNWLCAKGMPSGAVKALSVAALHAVYNDDARLTALMGSAFVDAPRVVPPEPVPVERHTEPFPVPARMSEPMCEHGILIDDLCRECIRSGEVAVIERVLPEFAQPATDLTADMKLSAAAEALRAAAALAKTHEALLARLEAIGMPAASPPASAAIPTHGAGPLEGTELVDAGDLFSGIAAGLMVPRYKDRTEHTPDIDPSYHFDAPTTTAILAGFSHNRRVLVSGPFGTGKSSHVEQIAARLNWRFFRLNLDGHISRTDMIGRDAIVLQDGKQITEFREGLLPWAMQQPMALCLDEYDAGRPDVLFVIQRLLESAGKLTIAEQNRVVTPHQGFRIFGTANTVGLGDASGLYHGTNAMNAAQMDRWSITVRLEYLATGDEVAIVRAKVPGIGPRTVRCMVKCAASTRALFAANKISTLMSPRTVITWAENTELFGDPELAFKLTFANRCDDAEMAAVTTCYRDAFKDASA